MSLSAAGFLDPSSGGVNSPYSNGGGSMGPTGHLSSPSPLQSSHNLSSPSPHYGTGGGPMPPANDLSSLLIGQGPPHLVGHPLGGMGPHSLHNGSPSSPSSAEDYFMVDMHLPQRMKKKGRKAKPLDGSGPPQQSSKRKSREGEDS